MKFVWTLVLIVFAAILSIPLPLTATNELPSELLRHGTVVMIIDPANGTIVDANEAAAEFYGYSLGTLRTMHIQDINALPPDEVVAEFTRAREQDRNYFIFPHRLANGQIRTMEVYSSPFVNDSGRKLLLSIIHDTTEKMMIEGELLRYKNQLEALVKQRTDEIVKQRHLGYWLALAAAASLVIALVFVFFALFIRRSRQQLLLQSQKRELLLALDAMTEASQQQLLDYALNAALQTAQSKYSSVGLMNDDESTMTLHSWSKEALDQCAVQNKPMHFPIAEAGLWGECVRQRRIITINDYSTPHAMKKGYPQGHVAITRLLGVPIFEGEKIVAVVLVANKRRPYAEADAQALTILLQRVWGRLQRNLAKTSLNAAGREINMLLEFMPSVLVRTDQEKTILRWNREAQVLFGITAENVLGRGLEEIPLSWPGQEVSKAVDACMTTGRLVSLHDLRFTHPDGRPGLMDLTVNTIPDEAGQTVGVLLLGREVTQLRQLESQLLQAQKLEAIGQLAAGIAHEINTPAQFVGDNAQFLRASFAELETVLDSFQEMLSAAGNRAVPADLVERMEIVLRDVDLEFLRREIPLALEQVQDGIGRISSIVRSMKEFAHPGDKEMTLADINSILENTMVVARNEYKYVADMAMELDPDLPFVPCLVDEIKQALLNIVVNAAHAIKDAVGDDPEKRGLIRITTAKVGDHAEIRISDTGTGIPQDIQTRIFDPFFTTKPVGRGTGQGLNIAYAAIVGKHGGTLTFETRQDQGTTFIIRLPLEER